MLIGDGLSDCCLARSASFTLARQGKALPRRCAGQEGLASSRERLLQLLV